MLSYMGHRVQRVEVPSHVGLEGNEIANDLAICGVCHSPLLGVIHGRPTPPPVVGAVKEPQLRSPSVSSFEGSDDESLRAFALDLPNRSSDSLGHNSSSMGSSEASGFAPTRHYDPYANLMVGYSDDTVAAPGTEVSDWEGHVRPPPLTLHFLNPSSHIPYKPRFQNVLTRQSRPPTLRRYWFVSPPHLTTLRFCNLVVALRVGGTHPIPPNPWHSHQPCSFRRAVRVYQTTPLSYRLRYFVFYIMQYLLLYLPFFRTYLDRCRLTCSGCSWALRHREPWTVVLVFPKIASKPPVTPGIQTASPPPPP